jgi:pyruvate,water dikinase
MASRDLVERLRALAELARAHEPIAATLASPDPGSLERLLVDLDGEHPFVTALKEFLAVHGHRCARELELMAVRWREDPEPVVAMIRGYLDVLPATDGHGRFLAAREELRRCTVSPARGWLLERLITRVRRYVTLREQSRHYYTMAFDTVRAKLKRFEQELLYTGKLKCADDLFFLRWDEALALSRDALGWRDVEERVRTRRTRWRTLARRAPAQTLNAEATPRASDRLTGECAAAGVAEGVALVMFDPTLDGDFRTGDILVAPYTDPAWTPLFPRAAAIVVEVGSFLSHAATIAREYGVPCLVDVEGCTERIRSGERIRVDATAGHVERLEP